jgi:hypothetical protein
MNEKSEFPIKGHIVWFECSVQALTEDEAKDLCTKHGVDFKVFPKLTKKKAFITAIRELENKMPGIIARQITTSNADHLLYAVVKEKDKKSLYDRSTGAVDGAADYEIENCIVYDRSNKNILYKFEDPALQEKVQKYLGTYTTSDIRRMVLRVFDNVHVEQMRKNGGVYFAPNTPEANEIIQNLRGLLSEIPGDCSLHYSEVIDSEHINESLVYYMKDRIFDEVDELKDHIEKVDLGRRRQYLLMQLKERYHGLQEKIKVYGAIFELVNESLEERMESTGDILLERISTT